MRKQQILYSMQAARLARITAALKELDFLFRNIPCFVTNPQNMIHELNRCTFMTTGNRNDTIQLLALVAAQYDDMSSTRLSSVLGTMLQQKTSSLIDDYFSSGSSNANRADAIVRIICESVPKTSPEALFAPVVLHLFCSQLASGIMKDHSAKFGYVVPGQVLNLVV